MCTMIDQANSTLRLPFLQRGQQQLAEEGAPRLWAQLAAWHVQGLEDAGRPASVHGMSNTVEPEAACFISHASHHHMHGNASIIHHFLGRIVNLRCVRERIQAGR